MSPASGGFASDPIGALPLDLAGGLPFPSHPLLSSLSKFLASGCAPEQRHVFITPPLQEILATFEQN